MLYIDSLLAKRYKSNEVSGDHLNEKLFYLETSIKRAGRRLNDPFV